MGRPAEPPDRAATSLAEFAVGLQALRLAAGSPSFEELARLSGQPAVELAAAVSGRIVPSFPITLAFVRACRGDENQWARRWHVLQERLGEEADRAAARLGEAPDGWAHSGWVPGAPEAPAAAWPAAGAPGAGEGHAGAPGSAAPGFAAPGFGAPGFAVRGAEEQRPGMPGEGGRGETPGVAASQGTWLNVTPADEWLAMASSLPSGEPLPPGEQGPGPGADSWVAGPGPGAESPPVPAADPWVAPPVPGREQAAGPAPLPWAAPTAPGTERQGPHGEPPDPRGGPHSWLPPTPHKDFRPPSWRPAGPPPPIVHEDRGDTARPQLAPDPRHRGAQPVGPATPARPWDAPGQPRAPGAAQPGAAQPGAAQPGAGRTGPGEGAAAGRGQATSDGDGEQASARAGTVSRPASGGRRPSGGLAGPGRSGPRPARVSPPVHRPRRPRGPHGTHRRHSPLLAGILAVFVVAALGFGYLMFFHHGKPGQAGQAGQAMPTQRAQPSAASRHTATGSPRVTSPAARPPATAAPGAAIFPALAGVGCHPSTGTSAVTGARSPGGDGWIGVGGGLPACGGQALATRKTGSAGLVQDTFTWTFRVGHPAACTAQIFIADTNPSSGFAQYGVYGDSPGPGASIGQFVINQGGMKGQWVQEGPWSVRDVLRIQLTDAPAYPGDTYHVTASAARASCS